MNGSEIAALIPNLSSKALDAELARAPLAKAAMEAAIAAKAAADTAKAAADTAKAAADAALAELQTAAGALTTALAAEDATIAGCAEEIAAVNALLPSDTE